MVGFEESQVKHHIRNQEYTMGMARMKKANFSAEFEETIKHKSWQPLGLLTAVKPLASRERYDSFFKLSTKIFIMGKPEAGTVSSLKQIPVPGRALLF